MIAIYPLVASVGTSLYDQSLLRPERNFVGFGNYTAVWGEFVAHVGTTLTFATLATIFPVVLGVALAILLNARIRGRNVLRGPLMLPWLLPGVVVSFLWAWIFNDSYGVPNHLLSRWSDCPRSACSATPTGAMAAVVIAKTWNSFPWIMVVALAVLQTPAGRADRGGDDRRRNPARSGSATSRCRTSSARCRSWRCWSSSTTSATSTPSSS